jgi:hypothetical protein
MIIMKILLYKMLMILIEQVAKKHKSLSLVLQSSIWLLILSYFVYRATFTRDSFFQGFAKERLQHGPNFKALKTVDKLTKQNLTKATYESQKHLIGICRFPKIWVNWFGAFDNFFWDFAH